MMAGRQKSRLFLKIGLYFGRILWYELMCTTQNEYGMEIMNRKMNIAVIIIIEEKLKLP